MKREKIKPIAQNVSCVCTHYCLCVCDGGVQRGATVIGTRV